MGEPENPFITVRAAPLIRAIEALRAMHGVSEHELCQRADLKDETWRCARDNPAGTSERSLRKLLDGLVKAVAVQQAQRRNVPWFPLAADVMTYGELRELAKEADAIGRVDLAAGLHTVGRRAAYKRSGRRHAGSHLFTASAIVWLQYHWALEIACREFRLKSVTSKARGIAFLLCIEEFFAPQNLLASVAGMTEPSVNEAIGRVRAALEGTGRRAADVAALERCVERLRGAKAVYEATEARRSAAERSRRGQANHFGKP